MLKELGFIMSKYKKGIICGIIFILISIIIGVIFEHDIAFIFAGIGVIIIGCSILAYINKDDV